jgi:outer membrane protein TolC
MWGVSRGRALPLVLLLTGAHVTASAQDVPVVRLSLEEAQRRAVEASHRLAEARARSDAASSAVGARLAAERPVVAASAGYTRTNHVQQFFVPSAIGRPLLIYPDVPDNYRTRLDLQWSIYNGGGTTALTRAARADAAAAASDVAAARSDLRLETARAFWALVTARATVGVLEQALVRARANLNDVRQRFAAGLVPPNEVASAEAQESRQRMLLIEAENQQALSAAELGRLVGVDGTPEPDAVLDAPALTSAGGAAALTAQALAAREERRALQQRVVAADEQRSAAAAGSKPTVGVIGGIDYARPNPRIFPRQDRWEDSWEAGVSVAWSLWDGGRVRADTAAAAALASAARSRVEEFDSLVALEVRQRLLEIDSGQAAVAAAMDGIRAATEARRVVGERYQAGVAIQTEVLDADVALLQAELDRTRALAGIRLAEARLARALGR